MMINTLIALYLYHWC